MAILVVGKQQLFNKYLSPLAVASLGGMSSFLDTSDDKVPWLTPGLRLNQQNALANTSSSITALSTMCGMFMIEDDRNGSVVSLIQPVSSGL